MARTQIVLGDEDKRALEDEESARQNARRSLVAAVDIVSGTTLTKSMLTWKRPAHGISPSEIDNVVGRKAIIDIASDEIIYPTHFENYSE